jgi:hypothetical protein
VQKAAHDVVVSLKIAMGRRPWTSHDILHQRADVEASKDWCELFKDPSYRGHSFLDLLNSKDKPIQPSTHKGGPWLSDSRVGTSTFSRLCRCITGHAPLGAYRQCFNISGGIHPRPRKLEGANTLTGGGPKNAVTPLLCIVLHAMPTIGRTTGA